MTWGVAWARLVAAYPTGAKAPGTPETGRLPPVCSPASRRRSCGQTRRGSTRPPHCPSIAPQRTARSPAKGANHCGPWVGTARALTDALARAARGALYAGAARYSSQPRALGFNNRTSSVLLSGRPPIGYIIVLIVFHPARCTNIVVFSSSFSYLQTATLARGPQPTARAFGGRCAGFAPPLQHTCMPRHVRVDYCRAWG
jgi:hypothetical protein